MSTEPLLSLADSELELLPPTLREMVGLIGLRHTIAVVQAYGGTHVYVPKTGTDDHPLAELVGGAANLRALCRRWGGNNALKIPRAKAALDALRNRQIASQHGPKSVRQLALEFSLTERRISQILEAHQAAVDARRQAAGQHALF